MANIIIKKPDTFGKTRSEQEMNLRNEGWGHTLTDEQLDKCKFLEKKAKKKLGISKILFRPVDIDMVK